MCIREFFLWKDILVLNYSYLRKPFLRSCFNFKRLADCWREWENFKKTESIDRNTSVTWFQWLSLRGIPTIVRFVLKQDLFTYIDRSSNTTGSNKVHS